MTCIGLDYYYSINQHWIESVLNDPWQQGPFTSASFKRLVITIENMQLICQNFGYVP